MILRTFILFFIFTNFIFANIEQSIKQNSINKEFANSFAKLIVQSKDGRMKPLDSLNLDILNKISNKTKFYSQDYNQVILGMIYLPELWKEVPMYKVNNSHIRKLLKKKKKLYSFNDFFDKNIYKLDMQTMLANTKEEKKLSSFEKELIKIYEKIQISKFIYNQGFLKIYPLEDSPNNKWYSPKDLKDNFSTPSKRKALNLAIKSKHQIKEAIETKNWENSFIIIEEISTYQEKYAKQIIPSKSKQRLELFYNDILLFEKLYIFYLLIASIFLINSFLMIFSQKKVFKVFDTIFKFIVIFSFILFTINILIRAYISGHAPWTNAYESMVFISWTILFAGICFYKKDNFSLPTTTLCTGFLLFAAHLNFIDPQITNLSPSLQSFWLNFHVATISAAYGFLALCALLGIVTMILFLFDEKLVKNQIEKTVLINEKSMLLGWSLLIIGTLLGSVWANESWGRVWAWDPKETWSLISILVYMLIIHLRYMKNYSIFLFTALSIVSYSSILMTYFGVNYFFDAIHVYASNSNVSIPIYVYVVVINIVALIFVANKKRKQRALS